MARAIDYLIIFLIIIISSIIVDKFYSPASLLDKYSITFDRDIIKSNIIFLKDDVINFVYKVKDNFYYLINNIKGGV